MAGPGGQEEENALPCVVASIYSDQFRLKRCGWLQSIAYNARLICLPLFLIITIIILWSRIFKKKMADKK